jgi:uncharacterized protein (DUF433 family)
MVWEEFEKKEELKKEEIKKSSPVTMISPNIAIITTNPENKTINKDEERKKELKQIMQSIGIFNLSKKALAERYNVTEQQIEEDIKIIIKGRKEDSKELEFGMELSIKNALAQAEKILNDQKSSVKEKLDAGITIADIYERYNKVKRRQEKGLHEF